LFSKRKRDLVTRHGHVVFVEPAELGFLTPVTIFLRGRIEREEDEEKSPNIGCGEEPEASTAWKRAEDPNPRGRGK